MLTFHDGGVRFITPTPAVEFCKYFNRRKEKKEEERA